jgi:hypothetical protein
MKIQNKYMDFMNLYHLHNDVTQLVGHDKQHVVIPQNAWSYAKTKFNDQLLGYDISKDVDYKLALKTIAKDTTLASDWAYYIIQAPFPEGEAAIAKDAYHAYKYASTILKKPFPAGEAAIAQDHKYALQYATLLNKPFPAGEAAIAKSGSCSLNYATNILHGRFVKGEEAIKDDDLYGFYRHSLKLAGEWGDDV